jgi:DUF971 family protein
MDARTMNYLEPTAIEAEDATNTLDITWSDGHVSRHNIEHLRWLCPCAECKGEWGQPGRLQGTTRLTPTQTRLEDVRPVGRYALQPVWGDGHDSGLYTYDYLRANCECPEHLGQETEIKD